MPPWGRSPWSATRTSWARHLEEAASSDQLSPYHPPCLLTLVDCPHLSNNHSLLSCQGCPQHFALLSIPILPAFFAALKLTALSLPLTLRATRVGSSLQGGRTPRELRAAGSKDQVARLCAPHRRGCPHIFIPSLPPVTAARPGPGFSLLSFFFSSLQSGGASCWLSGENSKGMTFQGA